MQVAVTPKMPRKEREERLGSQTVGIMTAAARSMKWAAEVARGARVLGPRMLNRLSPCNHSQAQQLSLQQ